MRSSPRRAAAVALVVAGALAGGCSQSLGHLSTLSTTEAPGPARAPNGPRVVGKSCTPWLLGYPVGTPSLEAATRAAQRANGAPLEDVVVTKTFWNAVV
ncbi:MAG TPA: hypothetical protein VHE35_33370, partial [Kofleriaceae bacterium]|nr:hypothetical protein [Kofleriaceae bacterium]